MKSIILPSLRGWVNVTITYFDIIIIIRFPLIGFVVKQQSLKYPGNLRQYLMFKLLCDECNCTTALQLPCLDHAPS